MSRKLDYKLKLLYVKYSPMLISLAILINNILSYFDIYVDFFNYVFGTSVLTVGHMYNSSKVYKFCKYHKMFIHYIVVNIIVNAIDYYFNIPLSDFLILLLYLILAAVFLFLILYYHQKYGGRRND
jgi:hypothetical protein|nr:MAG TPA: hypothetical protein [Bacteriophage sp.]